MKYFVIILALSITGCASQREGFDYLGKQPWYAVKAPHAPTCPCCFGKKVLTPAPLPAILKVQQSKKDNDMSMSKNARCSQIIRDVGRGKYVSNSKFRGYNPADEVDRPSWDMRPIKRVEVQAQRKIRVAQ